MIYPQFLCPIDDFPNIYSVCHSGYNFKQNVHMKRLISILLGYNEWYAPFLQWLLSGHMTAQYIILCGHMSVQYALNRQYSWFPHPLEHS